LVLLLFALALMSCSSPSQIIYITATPMRELMPTAGNGIEALATSTISIAASISPTASPVRSLQLAEDGTYTVVAGDTLFGIAQQFNTSVERLIALNNLENPDVLIVGQTISIPANGDSNTPANILMGDYDFVRGSNAPTRISDLMSGNTGYISQVQVAITDRRSDGSAYTVTLSGWDTIDRVSRETSIDARLLVAILEYRTGWLSIRQPLEVDFPLVSEEASKAARIDRKGLYRQLSWVANELNRGYYGWKFGNWTAMEFTDGVRVNFDESLNAATVSLHYMLHLERDINAWQTDISATGVIATYVRLFGSPTRLETPTYTPQPTLQLPFQAGERWYFTGGWHGGWGSGSAWAAVDFAPPDERASGGLCFTSEFGTRAVASGRIARSEPGLVVLDLDGDGDERTGWTLLYLHLASTGRLATGVTVAANDVIGYVSCEGGFSTATHLHIGRRLNGEWIPADCTPCGALSDGSFIMSGWRVYGLVGQEYQGSLQRGGETRVAEQGRTDPINWISH